MPKPMESMIRVGPDTEEEEVFCPKCGKWWPRSNFEEYTLVPRYAYLLTPVFQCYGPIGDERVCRHIFAITELAMRMRQDMALGIER